MGYQFHVGLAEKFFLPISPLSSCLLGLLHPSASEAAYASLACTAQ